MLRVRGRRLSYFMLTVYKHISGNTNMFRNFSDFLFINRFINAWIIVLQYNVLYPD